MRTWRGAGGRQCRDNAFLNWGDARSDGNGYAVFGKVVSGQDVVTKIAKTPAGAGGPFPRDVPRPAVVSVRDGRSDLVLRRETPDDLLALDAGLTG